MAAGDTSRGDDPRSEPDGVSNLLVCADTMDEAARRQYYAQLLPGRAATLRVLGVTYTSGPDRWVDEWRRYGGDPPAEAALISVADGMRSASATAASADGGPGLVHSVESPQDLTGLGITIGDRLDALGGTGVVVAFDSLTAMLQHVETKRAFRFLHVLATRIRSTGAVGHYHLNPAAHDSETLATLASVFDGRATFADGEWTVERRD